MGERQERLAEIMSLIQETAQGAERATVSPTRSRLQKERLRTAVADNYVALDNLNHVFQDINSTSALGYFDGHEAELIRQAASSLSDARRALRRLAKREWLRKTQTDPTK
jgi:hypothetical protein